MIKHPTPNELNQLRITNKDAQIEMTWINYLLSWDTQHQPN